MLLEWATAPYASPFPGTDIVTPDEESFTITEQGENEQSKYIVHLHGVARVWSTPPQYVDQVLYHLDQAPCKLNAYMFFCCFGLNFAVTVYSENKNHNTFNNT